jgi:hypothetical protein
MSKRYPIPVNTNAAPEDDPEAYLRRCLTLDKDDLNEEFCSVPAAIAYWNERLAFAVEAAHIAKIDYDREWARMFVMLRERDTGGKPLAAELVKAKCDSDEELYAMQLDHAKKSAEVTRLRGIVDAVLAKRDMTQSLGAKLREELRGDPALRHNDLTG